MTISMNKTYRTRDGREVRIYAVDGGGNDPVHGAYFENGVWAITEWNADGRWVSSTRDNPLDLIEVRPKRTLDIKLWVMKNGEFWFAPQCDAIACLHITRGYEEGEGLG